VTLKEGNMGMGNVVGEGEQDLGKGVRNMGMWNVDVVLSYSTN
jgi:hypothetical protein